MTRFMSAFGSQNFIRMPSMEDSYELALYLMLPGETPETAKISVWIPEGVAGVIHSVWIFVHWS